MFTLSQGTIDISINFSTSLQLLGFTSFSGGFSRSGSFSIERVASPSSNPATFVKLVAMRLTGDPTTNVDLTNVTLANGQSGQTITPKGFMLAAEWSDPDTGGDIYLAADTSDGYTGAYNLSTNVYAINPVSPLLVLFGKIGTEPTSSNKNLSITKQSGTSNPAYTYLLIWGD